MGRMRHQRHGAVSTCASNPSTDGAFANTERDGDLPLLPSELLQVPCSHPAPLPQVGSIEVLRVHAPL
jgi:hypothetical protein